LTDWPTDCLADWLTACWLLQEAEVKVLLRHAISALVNTFCFGSVHSVVLQPRRLVAWLEGASRMAVPECMQVMRMFEAMMMHRCPTRKNRAPEAAPGLAPAAQWKEGALQLRREVRHLVTATVTVTGGVTTTVTGKALVAVGGASAAA
jgi:hypothetical protein